VYWAASSVHETLIGTFSSVSMWCKFVCLDLLHSYICRTDPADVARVESKTYVVTKDKHQTVPRALEGAKGGMGQWMAPEVMQKEMDDRFRNCMAGMLVLSVRITGMQC